MNEVPGGDELDILDENGLKRRVSGILKGDDRGELLRYLVENCKEVADLDLSMGNDHLLVEIMKIDNLGFYLQSFVTRLEDLRLALTSLNKLLKDVDK